MLPAGVGSKGGAAGIDAETIQAITVRDRVVQMAAKIVIEPYSKRTFQRQLRSFAARHSGRCFLYWLGKKRRPLREFIAERPSNSKIHTLGYSVDSISNPQASNSGSGMYFEFLLRRAHSRNRVERRY